jgi:voltage-gated potassium channel
LFGTATHPWQTFKQRLAAVLAALLTLIVAGTVGFIVIGGWPAADALWMTVITVTAVGYEEVRPLTHTTRFIAAGLLGGGITLMGVWFAALTSAIVEMDLAHVFRTRRDMKRIEKLQKHVIVCGGGRTGRQIATELKSAGVPYVIVDRDESRAETIRRTDEEALVLVADATRDESLVQARIETARGLVACLSSDTDNLFVCLSARDLQPELTIVARAYDEQTMQKLYVAGADHVVSPNVTGGVRMASVLLRPNVVSFLDVMARGEGLALRLEQVDITPDSPLTGVSLAEARIPQRTGLIVIAIRAGDDSPKTPGDGPRRRRDGTAHQAFARSEWRYNPGPDESLKPGDALIVLGKPEQIDELTRLARA